jgi:membrane glycosyltransferase
MTLRRAGKTLHGTRVFIFFGLALLVTGGISILFADLLWRRGWTAGSWILMCFFVPLLFLNAVGAMHGIYGFFLRRFGDAQRITNLKEYESLDISGLSAAILFPIYNEEAAEVYARLRATYLSLEKTGELASFDFHILSDSTEPEKWVDEETRWVELMKSVRGRGRIFYRRRLWNEAKKSGNIRDFLTAMGNRYRYFIVFDADSFMTGETIVRLVKLMEANPSVGLIQTPPSAINAESLFGRLHQFANRLYGPLFTAGANYWVQGFGNYVGHNAIIRTLPFMKYCDLPQLPGRKPLGKQILSHDFVEAALMVRNHWEVWQAYDIEESYEEVPQGLIEYAQRDRRWCQGNMQHILVVFGRGLRGISRLHFIFGIFGFLSGPLWLLFLLAFNAQVLFQQRTGLSEITVQQWTPFLNMGATTHALLILGLAMLVLLAPKILALVELPRDTERARKFGGVWRASLSALLELFFSTLQAPLLMLWHTQFVASTLLGRSVSWAKQNRQADGTSWAFALRQHWKHSVIGVIWGFMLWRINPGLLGWFIPVLLVLLGMLLAVPLTVFTSRRHPGRRARNARLFLTPEETEPNTDIVQLRSALAQAARDDIQSEIPRVIADPYLNALHRSLLQRDERNGLLGKALEKLSKDQPPLESLREKILNEGWPALNAKETLLLLSDNRSVQWMHREVWARPTHRLGESWRTFFQGPARK